MVNLFEMLTILDTEFSADKNLSIPTSIDLLSMIKRDLSNSIQEFYFKTATA